MAVFNVLSEDMSWRQSELSLFKILLLKNSSTSLQRKSLLRAAWPILYSHYEGFTKFSIQVFYDEIKSMNFLYCNLPKKTLAFVLRKNIKKYKNMSDLDFIDILENYEKNKLKSVSDFPEVDTESNLWPHVLKELLKFADINADFVVKYEKKIQTLVSRRNEIAHGEKVFIDDIDYYLSYESEIYDFMSELIAEICSRLERFPYK